MLKVVVAYIDSAKMDAVRRDLADAGVSHMAAIAAGSATPEQFAATTYRGSSHTANLPEKLRLEFVVDFERIDRVKEAIFRQAGAKTFMFTLTVDEVLPDGAANPIAPSVAAEEAAAR